MTLLRIMILISLIVSLCVSAYCFVKIIREISQAEGKPGSFPFLAVFGGFFYLLNRHSRVVPSNRMRILFLLLVPINIVLLGLFLILGKT